MRDQLSKAFGALADPTRRDLVERLSCSEATVGELAEPYDISLQAVSKHLGVLEDAGLVSRRKDGQRRPVRLEPQVLSMIDAWVERYAHRVEERYTRLDDLLDDLNDHTSDEGSASA